MKRRLKYYLPVALLSGLIVFAIVNVAAWYNHRGEFGVCPNQMLTRYIILQHISQKIESYRKEHETLPLVLTDISDLENMMGKPDSPPTDPWDNLIQYRLNDSSYELFSYGRDGKVGGIGLDADIFPDGRNRKKALPTFSQFFLETDKSEINNGGFFMTSIFAGSMVAFIIFFSPIKEGKSKDTFKPAQLAVNALIIILIASVVGVFLLILHVPTGH